MRTGTSFHEFIKKKNRPLILDGAVGSFLQSQLKLDTTAMWSSELNITHPNEVTKLHQKYIHSGADIITTNTFRTNPLAIEQSGKKYQMDKLVQSTVNLALSAAEDKNIIIAGSNAPAEDCYQTERTIDAKDLEDNHKRHIDALWKSGVDFILNETMSHRDEIEIVCDYCNQNNIPFILSLYLNKNLMLLSGEELFEIIELIEDYSSLAIGINCVSPATFEKLDLSKFKKIRFGFYLNCGSGNVTDENIYCGISPEEYLSEVKKYINYNPLFIGACCGSTPDHTKVIREYFDEIYPN